MKKVVGLLLILSILFTLFMGYSFINLNILNQTVTGNTVLGNVFLYVLGNAPVVTINSPLNTSYDFDLGQNLSLLLNVSASQIISSWSYTLEDLTFNRVVSSNTIFTPNTNFTPSRRSNRLTVYANNTAGEIGSKSVIYYVHVNNTAPILSNFSSELYVCENTFLSYQFTATDSDEDNLTLSISPVTFFFIFPNSFTQTINVNSELFSPYMHKQHIGRYNETVSISDGQYTDSKSTNITVIEINNAPIVQTVGVQTIYSQGSDSTFNNQVIVNDIESGDSNSGNLSFNMTFLNGVKFFDINSTNGVMNFTANSSLLGIYNISVCVRDNNLSIISPNISICGDTGLAKTVCSNFSLTVTNQNRPPTIVSNLPSTLEFNTSDLTSLEFNFTSFDPDGTIPDTYWYLDNSLQKYSSGNNFDSYFHTFPCNVSGTHIIKAEVTDGISNDSVTWTAHVNEVSCPETFASSSSGGGGGGGGANCLEKWACSDYSTCQNTARSLEIGVLGGDDYRLINYQCTAENWDSSTCGVQIRSCFDSNSCNTTYTRPDLITSCQYITNPSCSDGIHNCHDGSCELLIDCGGPCGACPSCSDYKQNQGELGIDCGGPCPYVCSAESPFSIKSSLSVNYILNKINILINNDITIILLWIALILLLIILLTRLYKLMNERKEFEKERKIQSIFTKQLDN